MGNKKIKKKSNIITYSVIMADPDIDPAIAELAKAFKSRQGYLDKNPEANPTRIDIKLQGMPLGENGLVDQEVVMWAGASYENKEAAPYRRLRDGKIEPETIKKPTNDD